MDKHRWVGAKVIKILAAPWTVLIQGLWKASLDMHCSQDCLPSPSLTFTFPLARKGSLQCDWSSHGRIKYIKPFPHKWHNFAFLLSVGCNHAAFCSGACFLFPVCLSKLNRNDVGTMAMGSKVPWSSSHLFSSWWEKKISLWTLPHPHISLNYQSEEGQENNMPISQC